MKPTGASTKSIVVVAFPDAQILDVIGPLEVFSTANRVLERYGRPVFLIALEGKEGRGSARSVPGFPLPEALVAADDLLLQHGGHAEAAGFEIARDRLEAFRERIVERAGASRTESKGRALEIDARVELPNPDGTLRPGMFAQAVVQVPGGSGQAVVVPAEAVQEVEGQASVFVPTEVPGEFRPLPVEVGEALAGGLVTIRAGLEPGALIVQAGAFALRSELAAAELAGEEH